MVYMAADNSFNEDLFKELTDEAKADHKEMMAVGSNANMDIVVQVDWNFDRTGKRPQRIHVMPGRLNVIQEAPGAIDMGDPATLGNFLAWAQENYGSPRELIILWGHATHLGFGFDASSPLTTHALGPGAIGAVVGHGLQQAANDQRLLGFDACGFSTFESAFDLSNSARYMLASEIGMPLPGWPYTDILGAIADTPEINPQDLGKEIVNRFMNHYPDRTVALSMLDLPAATANGLEDALQELAVALALVVGTDPTRRENAIEVFRDARVPTGEPFVDVAQLCVNLFQAGISERVDAAAKAMATSLNNSGLIFNSKGHGDGATGLCGLSLYAPHVGRPFDSWFDVYDGMALFREKNVWPQLVEFLLLADSAGG
jgi:hypothetical protein